MITQELTDYVKTQLSTGVGREQITSDLLGQGWIMDQINEAFQALQQSVPVQMPQQETSFETTQTPKSIKYFEWLMYASFVISIIVGLVQLGSNIELAIILSASISYLIRLAFVYLIVYKRIAWPRMVLAVMLALGSLSILTAIAGFVNEFKILNLVLMAPVLLEIVAIYYAFTKESNEWLSQNKTITVTDREGNAVNIPVPSVQSGNVWIKAIPRTNTTAALVASGLFIFSVFGVGGGLGVFNNSTLGGFAYMMLWTMLGFGFFVLLENFVFRASLKERASSGLDPWIMMLVGTRNVVVILSMIPLIQLLGMAAVGLGAIPWLIIYVILIILRFRK